MRGQAYQQTPTCNVTDELGVWRLILTSRKRKAKTGDRRRGRCGAGYDETSAARLNSRNGYALSSYSDSQRQATPRKEPDYTVVQKFEAIEIRQYDGYSVAEVVVPGPAADAGNQGFPILAGYIYGKKQG